MQEIILYNGKVKIYRGRYKSFFTDKEETNKILSVGKINGCLAKDALKFWAAACTAEEIFEKWQIKKNYTEQERVEIIKRASTAHLRELGKKAKKGKKIHEFAEDFSNGLKPEMPNDTKVLNGVNAFLQWFSSTDIKPVATERIVYSKKFNIVGIADQLGIKKRKKTKHVLDYKTVSMYKRAKAWELKMWPDGLAKNSDGELIKYPVFLEPRIQVSCYRGMIMEETGEYYGESYILRFDQETGDVDCEVISPEFQDEAWKMFSSHQIAVKKFLDKYTIKPY